ncbi:BQ5605_C013g07251 [Microbotryum silenes-dioicae]|uniref:BQ5605_C013g07251 protein n=1 Tax=Microbotryum silenes-dioicae TaxID=796604 RepID=A0A2X0LVH6_9BASI|nr:BQ5605_C013g07251 [Microbotryum silenes-dioicae]
MLPQTLQPHTQIPAASNSSAGASSDSAKDVAAAERALIERKKMLAGEAYDSMQDQGLLEGRLKARHLLHPAPPGREHRGRMLMGPHLGHWTSPLAQAYNHHPPATYVKGMNGAEYFGEDCGITLLSFPFLCRGPDSRWSILAELFQIPLEKMKKIAIEPPFYCDYGCNIKFKGEFYSNFGLTILDCAEVTWGERVIVAPNVQVYAATHSVDVAERQAGLERAYPVTVGDDCWIGGSAVLIGPCTIGSGCTVAAGAVVRGTFPDNCVIGGTPARILKKLDPPAAS